MRFIGIDPSYLDGLDGVHNEENSARGKVVRGVRKAEQEWHVDPYGRGERLVGKRRERNPHGIGQWLFGSEGERATSGLETVRGLWGEESLVDGGRRPWERWYGVQMTLPFR